MYRWLVPRLVLPLAERVGGRRMGQEGRRLREMQWLAPEELDARVLARLRGLLAHAAAHVPYYRRRFARAGFQPGDLRSLSDLVRVPITTKADLRAAGPLGAVAENLPATRRRPMVTSGSTGAPLEFYWDRACADEVLGAYLFSLELAGAAIWQTRIVVASPAYFYANTAPDSRARRWARRIVLGEQSRSLPADTATAAAFHDLVSGVSPRGYFVRGYPSAIAHLARGLGERPLPAPPSAVLAFAETLTPANAAAIRSVLRCRVTNYYTSWEVPQMAQSCPANPEVLHVNSGRVVLRVVRPDGTAAPVGEPGRVVVTDLANHVMPFVNYAVDDVAVLGPPCACGRGLPTLTAVEGRTLEQLTTPGGRRVGGGMLGQFLVSVAGVIPYVLEYQAHQTARDAVVLRVVPTGRFTSEFGASLRRQLETFLGSDVSVTLEVVDRISLEPSGKRLIIKPAAF